MADALSAKQQITDKIKELSNILVTVGSDPSVDELSAALGLTIMLNKLKKHATAVASGDMPPAITFLDPEKTFETTVDSLRDFIIALDKEKADHLRYKVDGDVVKIFITPYRTTITQDDLEFSQGDYNVELVLALGVKDEAHLDKALKAHGKIFHDATVATISASSEPSNLGSIDWYDESASCLSEMLVSLSEAIKADKPLLDEQTATALLTGIVAATDRFSNERTSAKVMTMAAQLMAAGANQQLIATKLEEAHEIKSSDDETPKSDDANDNDTPHDDAAPKQEQPSEKSDGSVPLNEGASTKLPRKPAEMPTRQQKKKPSKPEADGTLSISHEKEGDLDEVADQVAKENAEAATEAANESFSALDEAASQVDKKNTEAAAKEAERKLAEELQAVAPAAAAPPKKSEPLLGGTLNATTEEAAEEKRREEESDRNKTLLSHGESGHVSLDQTPTLPPPFSASMQPEQASQPSVATASSDRPVDLSSSVLSPSASAAAPQSFMPQPQPEPQPQPPVMPAAPVEAMPSPVAPTPPPLGQTLADIDASMRQPQAQAQPHEEARAAVAAAFDATPTPAGLPPMPDFSTLPPLPPSGDAQLGGVTDQPQSAQSVPSSQDPGQFKIPGQS